MIYIFNIQLQTIFKKITCFYLTIIINIHLYGFNYSDLTQIIIWFQVDISI